MDESSAAKEAEATARPALSVIAERYRVLRVLGEGSSGIVYLCEHTALEKEVAVKVLHRDLADNADLVARFTREAQTAARLDHPSSVHVMDFGQDRDGTLYLVMEYVEGRDLAQLLDEKPALDDERIAHIMSCILSALSAAHALGIVHRDLKPENVLIRPDPSAPDQDIVKVCDFGVAQFSPVRMAHNNNHARSSATRRVTGEGMLVGTPWYMSPEQARAEKLDARSDIYSAGVVLFQLLTRTLPFMGDDLMAVALMHCTTPPPPPSGFGAVHPGLEAVCLRALSKTREARYQSANDMLLELRDAVSTKRASRSLARVSKTPSVPGAMLAVSPLAAAYPTLSGTSTPLGTPTVKHPPTLRKRKRMPSLLLAGVATTVLGIVTLPRVLPSESRILAMWKLFGSQPSAAEMRVPSETTLQPMAAAPGAPAPIAAPLDSLLPPASAAPTLAQATPVPPPAAAPRARKPRANHASTPAARPVASSPTPSESDGTAAPADTETVTAPPAQPSAATETAPAAPAAPAANDQNEPQPATPAPAVDAPAKPQPTAATPAPEVETKPQPPAAQSSAKIARVEISADHLPPGTSRVSLRSALNHASLVSCYAQARQRAPQASLPATALELKTNTSGRIVWAHATNTGLPAPLRDCLEQVARSGHIRTGEGGEVQATLNLSPAP